MKKLMMVFVFGIIAAGWVVSTQPVSAQMFDVEVIIPQANDADFTVWKLFDGQAFPDTPEGSPDLSFDVTLDTDLGTFFGDFFYAIDVSPIGGVGQLNVDITYDDLLNPNGGIDDGLSTKGIATVVRVEAGTPGIACQDNSICPETVLEREVLRDIDGASILATDIEPVGGFMRMYVGLATGDPMANPAEPAAAVPFNLGDTDGTYMGRITLSVMQP